MTENRYSRDLTNIYLLKSGDVYEAVNACLISLNQAMRDAGNEPLSEEEMANMRLMDFIIQVASQNNIHFVYNPQKKQDDANQKTDC